MKCENFIKTFGHLSRENLPVEAQQLLEADPALEQAFAQVELQGRLLRLKQYEQPEPTLEGRVLYNVRTRLEAGETMDVPELRPAGFANGWINGATLSFGTAVLVLALVVGIYMNQKPPLEQPAVVRSGPDINNLFKPIPTSTNGPMNVIADDYGLIYPLTNNLDRLPPNARPIVGPAPQP
ncbi:MAG: hypothetical protein ACI9TH_003794 [Kiritimatiellia bacterium]|jgi:hypothetical protein